MTTQTQHESKTKLVEAALRVFCAKGYSATTIDDICAESALTKGSFFHHFKSKEDLGQAAVKAWGELGQAVYARAWKQPGKPLEEIHRLFDIMESLTRRPEPCVCVVGMISQEMSGEHPDFRAACERELGVWTEMMRHRLEAAKQQLKPTVDFDPAEVAWFLNSIWQGSMLVGKTVQSPELIRANLRQARAYVDSLFANADKPVCEFTPS